MGVDNTNLQPFFPEFASPEDLAPHDQTRVLSRNWNALRVRRVSDPADPWFSKAYARLCTEFGPRGEIEQEEILVHRLRWNPSQIQQTEHGRYAFLYELLVVCDADNKLVAVRDHTVVIPFDEPSGEIFVHLSHVFIEPEHRGSGLAGWLRICPIQTARRALKLARADGVSRLDRPIVLVAEMEALENGTHGPDAIARNVRLKSYARGGFSVIDPSIVHYSQPDFRASAIIDEAGGASPLALNLIIRRVGQESLTEISAYSVQALIRSLYIMYGAYFRPRDMEAVWSRWREQYPKLPKMIALVHP